MKPKAVVLLSGGMDSTTLAWFMLDAGWDLRALSVNYGQRHQKELFRAKQVANRLQIPFQEVDLQPLAKLLPGSSQMDPAVEVPEGHYTEETMKKTVVPNRNMILLSIATAHAIAHGCMAVAYAAHAGDHTIYPDCRPEFTEALQKAIDLCDWTRIRLHHPFIQLTKADIVRVGMGIGVDYSLTWSCYKGGEVHCGRCGTCIERREAFHLAGYRDPVVYDPSAPDWKTFKPGNQVATQITI